MTATHIGNGHGNGSLVVEDNENLTFSVNRKVFVSDDVLETETGRSSTSAGSMSATPRS